MDESQERALPLRPGNAQHQGAREAQQDAFGFSDLEEAAFVAHAGFLGMVADGMGGLAHGGAASLTAVRALLRSYEFKTPGESIPAALLRALQRANDAVLDLARDFDEPDAIGTTAAVVVVHDWTLHWIAAGDTRIYLWREGRLTQVTADHVYAAELAARVAAGRLAAGDAQRDPDREALTSHLGLRPLRTIDRSVRPFPLAPRDRVFVCSDGLYRALTLDDMAAPLAGDPQHACEALVDRVVARRLPRQDNLTAIAIGLEGPPPAERRDDRPGWRRRLVQLAVVLLAVLATACGRHRVSSPDDVGPSVVHLFTFGNGVVSMGSGFFVNDGGTIITNHHVVRLALDQNLPVYVMTDRQDRELAPDLQNIKGESESYNAIFRYVQKHGLKATVTWSDPHQDLAILDPGQMADAVGLPLTVSDFVRPGDRVIAFGFPGINAHMGGSATITLDRRPGEITGSHEVPSQNRRLYTTSGNTYHGMSGGPAVDACGEVLGVVVGGFFDAKDGGPTETVTTFIQTDTLIPQLDAHAIGYTRVSSRCAPVAEGGGRDPLTTGGLVVALGLGVAGLVLGASKRGRAVVRAATDSVSQRLTRSPVESRPQPAPRPTPAVRPTPASETPMLRGVAGEYAGVELELSDEPIALGRDPRLSNLVFSPASAVSARHCALWFDADTQAVMIEDFGSTNGTFLADGRRLAGGSPERLRPHDQFYLSSPDIRFEVRY